MFLSHVGCPRRADAVLAGRRAAHSQGELVDVVGHAQHTLNLVWIAAIDQVARMQATAADVTVCGDRDAMAGTDVLDCAQGLGDLRHGHTDVFAAIRPVRARPQHAYGRADYRASFPQRVDASWLGGPLRALGEWRDDLADSFGIPAHTRRITVYFKQDECLDARQVHRRPVQIDGLETALIENLDRRRAHASAKNSLNGRAGLFQRVEQTQHDGPRRRDGHELEPQPGDDSQRAFRADDQLRQLEPRRRLLGARTDRAGLDLLSVWQDHVQAQDPGAGGPVLDGAHPVRVGRGHAAHGGHTTRARIGREQQAVRRQGGVQLGVHDARFADDLHVGYVDLQHAVHRVEGQDDAA